MFGCVGSGMCQAGVPGFACANSAHMSMSGYTYCSVTEVLIHQAAHVM